MAHTPNDLSRQIVKNMAKLLYKKDIAKYLGIDPKTLNKHYENELNVRYETCLEIAREIYNIGMTDTNSAVRLKALIWTMENIFKMKHLGPSEAEADKEKSEDTQITKIEVEIAKPDNKKKA